ncbi:hypothetical protein OENI_100011 [Oenococcus oeni]|nr:hypothetical protein OENI_100011 [Oenococcus oeni]
MSSEAPKLLTAAGREKLVCLKHDGSGKPIQSSRLAQTVSSATP